MEIDIMLWELTYILECDEDEIHSYQVWDKVVFVRFHNRRPTFVSKSLFVEDSMYAIGVLYRAIRDEKPQEERQRIKRHLHPSHLLGYYNWRDIVDEVRAGFGSCTYVYEAYTREELIESIRYSESLNDWCRRKCEMENIDGLKERLQRAGLLD